jgi:hypothetical protein
LKHESRLFNPPAARHGDEFGPLPQTLHVAVPGPAGKGRSGGQPLATARPAGVDDLAPAFRGHAGAKTVAALPYELARLICALHVAVPEARSMPAIIAPQRRRPCPRV